MSVIAKFPAICPLCGKKIVPGKSEVKKHPNSNVNRWVHTSCAGGGTQQRLFK